MEAANGYRIRSKHISDACSIRPRASPTRSYFRRFIREGNTIKGKVQSPALYSHNLHGFTNWQFHHFCAFWSREISHLIKLRRARRAERPMVKTTTWNPTAATAPKVENTARNETTPVSAAMVTPPRAIKAEESSTKPYERQEVKEKEKEDDGDDDELPFPLQQNPKKIADKYSCLDAINSKAPPDLIEAFKYAHSKQDPSHTQSSKRRRASNKSGDPSTKRRRQE